jgi:hypothetical protein
MAQGTGNYKEFIEQEVVRLRKTEEPTIRSEVQRLRNLNHHKTLRNGKEKGSKINIR